MKRVTTASGLLTAIVLIMLVLGCYTVILPPLSERPETQQTTEETYYMRQGDIYNYFYNNPFYYDPWWGWYGGYYSPYYLDPFWYSRRFDYWQWRYNPYLFDPMYGYYYPMMYYPYYYPYYSYFPDYGHIGATYPYPYEPVTYNKKRDFVKRGETVVVKNDRGVPSLGVTFTQLSAVIDNKVSKGLGLRETKSQENAKNTRTVVKSTSPPKNYPPLPPSWGRTTTSSGSWGSSSSSSSAGRTVIKSGSVGGGSAGGGSRGGAAGSSGSSSAGGRTVIKKGGNN